MYRRKDLSENMQSGKEDSEMRCFTLSITKEIYNAAREDLNANHKIQIKKPSRNSNFEKGNRDILYSHIISRKEKR